MRALPLLALSAACAPNAPPPVNGCTTVHLEGRPLVRDGDRFAFARGEAARFFVKPADLGSVLLYDSDRGYLVAGDGDVWLRQTTLESDVTRGEDGYVSPAEWELGDGLRNRRSGRSLPVRFAPADGCVAPPELSLDAEGAVGRTRFDDGDLYGIADTHEHVMSNWGFGGGGIFHGAPFHRLGVEHALADCAAHHGEAGRKDFLGYTFDAGADALDLTDLLPALLAGELAADNHATDGYPTFTDWPNAPTRATHQAAYYKWIERAWLGGLRLLVQHATSNAVLCELTAGATGLPTRYSCEDSVGIDRSIDEAYALERYVDAQAGGPGAGWFRIVTSPAAAREVIGAGKLAVVLGIETADLFGCKLVPGPMDPVCDEAYVVAELDRYEALGVRAIFPVHKYDNAFSAGDGDRGFIEVGNFLHTGHWSNFVTEGCPDLPAVFDEGDVAFGGLNAPRADYFAPPPNDLSSFPADPVETALPYVGNLLEPPLVGDYCQNAGLTPLGEFLIGELMRRGMIVELDHLPRRSYQRAFELLAANDYPAAGTHGNTNDGKIYEHGGISKVHLGQCRDPDAPGATLASLNAHLAQIRAAGGYEAEGFGFDLNGLAGARGPRFAPGACAEPQEDPVVYPFQSYAGDVTFTEPFVGERAIDFNEEGFVHLGMLPELIEDARNDAGDDAALEPLFRSAEGYVRMWELAEDRRGR